MHTRDLLLDPLDQFLKDLHDKTRLDRTLWGMTYGQGKIHDDVTLTINVNAKK